MRKSPPFYLLTLQNKEKLQQKPFAANFGLCSSCWSLSTMHQNFKQSTNSCPKTGCHSRVWESVQLCSVSMFQDSWRYVLHNAYEEQMPKHACLQVFWSVFGIGADSIVRRIKSCALKYKTFKAHAPAFSIAFNQPIEALAYASINSSGAHPPRAPRGICSCC